MPHSWTTCRDINILLQNIKGVVGHIKQNGAPIHHDNVKRLLTECLSIADDMYADVEAHRHTQQLIDLCHTHPEIIEQTFQTRFEWSDIDPYDDDFGIDMNSIAIAAVMAMLVIGQRNNTPIEQAINEDELCYMYRYGKHRPRSFPDRDSEWYHMCHVVDQWQVDATDADFSQPLKRSAGFVITVQSPKEKLPMKCQ